MSSLTSSSASPAKNTGPSTSTKAGPPVPSMAKPGSPIPLSMRTSPTADSPLEVTVL